MIVYKGRLLSIISQKNLWIKKLVLSMLVTAWLSNIANFCWDQLRIMPEIVSKLLCAVIWRCCAVLFESELTPFFQKSHQIISAVFARDSIWNILFCSYVIFLLKSSQLCHWFCSQNLWLSPGKTFRSNCQMTCRCKNVDSNLNSAAWAMGCGCSRILLLVQFRQGVPQICHLWVSEGEEWMLPVPPSFPQWSHPTALLSTKRGYNVLQDNLGKFQVILKTLTDQIPA